MKLIDLILSAIFYFLSLILWITHAPVEKQTLFLIAGLCCSILYEVRK